MISLLILKKRCHWFSEHLQYSLSVFRAKHYYCKTRVQKSRGKFTANRQHRHNFFTAIMPKYRLTYFNFKGLGEPIRFILSYGGVEFEDIRIDRTKSWPQVKPTMPYGQVPILEIDGKIYHQTLPICRYLAKQFNIGGKTDLEALEIDAIANSIHDFRKSLSLYYFEPNPTEKEKKRGIILNESLPFYMKRFDDLVKNNGGYFHREELSYADLFFAGVYEHMNSFLGVDVIKDYPNLRQLTDKVFTLPKIAAWIARRPESSL